MRILLVSFLLVAQPLLAQEHPFERFVGSYSVIETTLPAPGATIVFAPATGHGIHSTWKHGRGDASYEAHALWGYDAASKQVQVLEVNSAGVVALHVGGFDPTNSLTLQRYAEDGRTLLERRVFSWSDSSILRMTLQLSGAGESQEHTIILRKR